MTKNLSIFLPLCGYIKKNKKGCESRQSVDEELEGLGFKSLGEFLEHFRDLWVVLRTHPCPSFFWVADHHRIFIFFKKFFLEHVIYFESETWQIVNFL
jgi:hypothetical protein